MLYNRIGTYSCPYAERVPMGYMIGAGGTIVAPYGWFFETCYGVVETISKKRGLNYRTYKTIELVQYDSLIARMNKIANIMNGDDPKYEGVAWGVGFWEELDLIDNRYFVLHGMPKDAKVVGIKAGLGEGEAGECAQSSWAEVFDEYVHRTGERDAIHKELNLKSFYESATMNVRGRLRYGAKEVTRPRLKEL